MPRKRHSPEQILRKLREVEVALAKGETVAQAVRQIAVTEQTYYRWRNEYGGLSIDQARRLKKLEQENARLKRAVAALTLDKLILKEAAEGNFRALHVAATQPPLRVPNCSLGARSGAVSGKVGGLIEGSDL